MNLALPPILDTEAATPLRSALVQAIGNGEPLILDGSAVARIGMACLQVLAAAKMAAEAIGLPFWLCEPSAALAGAARMTALDALIEA